MKTHRTKVDSNPTAITLVSTSAWRMMRFLIVLTLGFTLRASAYTSSDIVINAGAQQGALNHLASGFLHPFNLPVVTPPVSSDYAALKVKCIRTGAAYVPQAVTIDRNAGGNAVFIVGLSDSWGAPLIGTPNGPWGADPNAPDWSAWLQMVANNVNATKNLTNPPPIYDIWNEPDSGGFWGNWFPVGWTDQQKADLFFELYARTYDAIKAIDPNLQTTGPTCSSYLGNPNTALNVSWFKDECVAAGRIPTYWNWHFGDTAIETNVNTAQSWGLNLGTLITEHLEQSQGTRPGRVAYDLAQLESAGVILSNQARWPGDTQCGNSFTDNNYSAKTGNWYLHNFYANMTGTRIAATASVGLIPFRAVASLDNTAHTLSSILGDSTASGSNGDITLKFQGIKPFSGTQVALTVSQVPFNGSYTAVSGLVTILSGTYTPDAAGNLTIPSFNWGKVEQSYLVQVSNVTYLSGSTAPAAPTGLTAAAVSGTQVNLSWTASPGATSYNIKRTTATGPYTTIKSQAATSYNNIGLTGSTNYLYVVSAVNAAGESLTSTQASATTPTTPPLAPAGLIATGAPTQVYLSWLASWSATSYNIKRATAHGGPYTTVATGVTAASYINTNLTNGFAYYYVVSAVNALGEGANSSEVGATPYATPAPSELIASATTSNQSNLRWTAAVAANSYNVKRSTVNGGPYTTVATGVTATSYNDSGLLPVTSYYYVVTAVNGAGESLNSNQASATTQQTVLIGDNADGTGVTITGAWSTSTASGCYGPNALTSGNNTSASVRFTPTLPATATYDVYARWSVNANRATNTPIDVISASGTSTFVENQQANGGTWNLLGSFTFNVGTTGGVLVRANGVNGYAVADAVKFVQTSGYVSPPPAPTGLTAAAASNSQINLSWQSAAGANSYNVKRATVSGGPYTTIASGVASTAYNNPGLSGSTTYYYVVSAVNTSGEGANSAQASATTQQVTIIKDNADGSGVTISGTWYTTTLAGCYGADGLYTPGPSSATVRFTPTIPATGTYNVYAQWSAHANRCANTPIDVISASGTTTQAVNQQINGGTWNLLGSFTFNAGTTGSVLIRANGVTGNIVADAVKFVSP